VNEAALRRLRHAIVAEDGDDEQLGGVLRMLGAALPDETQLTLFGQATGRPRRRQTDPLPGSPNFSLTH
jgi:hypothetical protein